MTKLDKLPTKFSFEQLEDALLCSPNTFVENHGRIALAQMALNVENVEIDTMMDEIAEKFPSLVVYYQQSYSLLNFLVTSQVWLFRDGSMMVYKGGSLKAYLL